MDDVDAIAAWEARTALNRRISELPVQRQLHYRSKDGGRVALGNHSSYRQALMAFIRGYVAERACAHCRNGHGPMADCVRAELDGEHFFAGACTKCLWGGQAKRYCHGLGT